MSILAAILRWTMFVALTTAVAACESGTFDYHNIQHPANGPVEWSRDLYQCKRENTQQAMMTRWGQLTGGPGADEDMAGACLGARGWRLMTSDSPPTRGSFR